MILSRILVVSFTFVVALALRGGGIAPMDLQALRGQSTLILLGEVVESRVKQNGHGLLEKVATIKVATTLYGTYSGKVIRVRTRTGLVFFDRHLVAGDGGVFFLKPSSRGDFEAAYPGSLALFQTGTFNNTVK